MCLFSWEYQIVLITVALWYSLISDIVIPHTLFFFLKIAEVLRAIYGSIKFFEMYILISVKYFIGILVRIALE